MTGRITAVRGEAKGDFQGEALWAMIPDDTRIGIRWIPVAGTDSMSKVEEAGDNPVGKRFTLILQTQELTLEKNNSKELIE